MIRSLIAGMFICLCLTACEEPDLVSTEVIPGTDQPGVFNDSLELTAFTTTDRQLVSNSTTLPMLLGSINDQEIGTTAASFYIQMLLAASAPPAVPSTGVVDSMVISLAYSSLFGDSAATHTVSVYEMGQKLVGENTTYYTTDSFTLANPGIPIATVVTVPSLTDSAIVGGVQQAPQLRIPVDAITAEKFLNAMKNNTAVFTDNTSLTNFFNGLYFTSSADNNGSGDVKGSIMAFYPGSSINTVTLYYRDQSTDTIGKSYSFQLNSSSVRSNRAVHTYNPGIIDDSLQTPSLLYVQALNGLRIKVKLSGLKDFLQQQGTISVNKAELILKLKSNSTSIIKANSQLVTIEEDNSFIADYGEEGFLQSEGFLDGDTYRLRISQQMQRMVNGEVPDYIYITSSDRITNAFRTVLEGAGSIKLNLTYTKNN
jgi:hypothetical protein